MLKITQFILFISFILSTPNAFSLELHGAGKLAYEWGGKRLVGATYTDGSDSDISSGGGFIISGGGLLELYNSNSHAFELEGTLGIKWDSIKEASNAEADWTRFPLELLAVYKNTDKNMRLAIGPVYQFGNKLDGTGDASFITTSFKNTQGMIFEAAYLWGDKKNAAVGLRRTTIEYSPKTGGPSVDGSSWGIVLTFFGVDDKDVPKATNELPIKPVPSEKSEK